MALFGFGNKKEGGIMDVIRCDEQDYLVWKWSPAGINSKKEDAIRYGSSLRVKDGEVAVFVYKQANGTMQDYVEGPFDQTIKTANLPILTSIVGSAFGGASPFQAEIYYINLAKSIVMPFSVNIGHVVEVRSNAYSAPVQLNGQITFNIADYEQFIKKIRMREYTLETFRSDAIGTITEKLVGAVNEVVINNNIPIIKLPGCVKIVSAAVAPDIIQILGTNYVLNVQTVAISAIIPDTDHADYKGFKENQKWAEMETLTTNTNVSNQNTRDMQGVTVANTAEALRIQREETQRAQRLNTEANYLNTHQLNLQADVSKTAAKSLGQMGGSIGSGGDGGFNPAGMMAGMMMGGAVGSNMTNMMGNMMQGVNTPQPPAPPQGVTAEFHVVVNGQQSGPYTVDQLRQLMANGSFSKDTYVWKNGMAGWEFASAVAELASLFAVAAPPPIPGGTPPPPPIS